MARQHLVAIAILAPMVLAGCTGLEAIVRPQPGAGGADPDEVAAPAPSADTENTAREDGTNVNVGDNGGPVFTATGNGFIVIGEEAAVRILAEARRAAADAGPQPDTEPEEESEPEPVPADTADVTDGALLEWERLDPEPAPAIALDTLRDSLMEWEDLRIEPYDLFGAWHVCVGHRTGGPGADDHRPHTVQECLALLETDMTEALAGAERVAGAETWAALSPARRAVLAELAYILGEEGLAGFGNTIEAVRAGDFGRAGDEVILSLLPRQDQIGPGRTRDLASRMRAG